MKNLEENNELDGLNLGGNSKKKGRFNPVNKTFKGRNHDTLSYLESEIGPVVGAEEIRQYFYCKRIPFLRHIQNKKVPTTYLQDIGTALHNRQGELRARRIKENKGRIKSLDFTQEERYLKSRGLVNLYGVDGGLDDENPEPNFPVEIGDEYYELYLYDAGLGLVGIIDYLQYREGEAWPVEIKTGQEPRNRISNPHKYQLAALALLIESNFDFHVNKAVIRYTLSKKTITLNISYHDKVTVINAIRHIKDSLIHERIPKPTKFESMCRTCEYFNRCGGV